MKPLRQAIILKADDMIYDPDHIISPQWERFIHVARVKKLRIGIGIIANSLEDCDPAYLRKLRSLHEEGFVEFWNHGYDHLLDGTNVKGERFHEFENTSVDDQLMHLKKSQALAVEKLGIQMRTFGAPGNAIDDHTVRALEEIGEINVWLFGTASDKLVLERWCNMEFPIFRPNYGKFIENYKAEKEYLVLQMHPRCWEREDLNQFVQIIDFLAARKVEFVTPYELYQMKKER